MSFGPALCIWAIDNIEMLLAEGGMGQIIGRRDEDDLGIARDLDAAGAS